MSDPEGEPGGGDRLIAITGATGFIGSHLLRCLHDRGQRNRALIRSKAGREVAVPQSTEIVPGSLSDPLSIQALLKGAKTCIHLAGATKSVDANGFHFANVIGTYNVAACAAKAGVEHFICVSSQAARDPAVSDYAASKATSEAALGPFKAQMKITIIRPPAVIGPGDPMLQPMFDLIRLGWLPAPSEPRNGPRSFAVISVGDLVEQILASTENGGADASLIAPCSVRASTWQQVGEAAGVALGRKVRVLKIWSGVLQAVGLIADGVAKLTRRPMPISHGKVREMLAADWTYDHPVRDAMNLDAILRACFLDQKS